MSHPVTITYSLSEDDYMQGCYQLWAHRALGRAGNIMVGVATGAIGLFLI